MLFSGRSSNVDHDQQQRRSSKLLLLGEPRVNALELNGVWAQTPLLLFLFSYYSCSIARNRSMQRGDRYRNYFKSASSNFDTFQV